MDENRLLEIEKRASRATSPPWSTTPSGKTYEGFSLDVLIAATAPGKFNRVYATPTGGHFPAADQDFIVHARQDVPDLVAELRRCHLAVAALDMILFPGDKREPEDTARMRSQLIDALAEEMERRGWAGGAEENVGYIAEAVQRAKGLYAALHRDKGGAT